MGCLVERRERWFAEFESCRERGQNGAIVTCRTGKRCTVDPRFTEDQTRYLRRSVRILPGLLAYWINVVRHSARTVY